MDELRILEGAILTACLALDDPVERVSKDTDLGVYDVVTDVDTRVERSILDDIRRAFPDDTIISEETSPDAKVAGRTWALDPIDGTMNMTRGIPMFGSQGTFMEDGVPKASVIYLPNQQELYKASGDGAFLNGIPLRTAEPRPLRECILSTGDYSRKNPAYREMQARLMCDCRDSVARFKMFGAACMDFTYLASGRTDIHMRFVNKLWDFMPGLHIARTAGAVYDERLLEDTGILIMCSCREVLDEALAEILPRISSSSCRR